MNLTIIIINYLLNSVESRLCCMLENKPNYYAIIPANVRYDKDLSPNAKLLYGEITALCNEKGYCWACNQYFTDLYDISDRQIQRLLKQLNDKKYIRIEILDNTKRHIYITDTYDKNVVGSTTKMSLGYDKNVVHNNKINNINIINKKNKEEFIDYDWLNVRL